MTVRLGYGVRMAYRRDRIEAWPDCEVKDFLLPDDQLAKIAEELFAVVVGGQAHALSLREKRQLVLDLGRVCGMAAQALHRHQNAMANLRHENAGLRHMLKRAAAPSQDCVHAELMPPARSP